MKKISAKKIIILILAAAIIISSVVFVTAYDVKNIEVIGNEICSEEEIISGYLDGPLGSNRWIIMLKDKLDAFDEISFVRDADIEYVDRNSITIQVYEKSIVACFNYMGEYIYFDKDGVILETSGDMKEGIPLIEGIAFNNFALNEKISVNDDSQIATILDISELINHYEVYVEKVVFNNQNEVILNCGDIKVFLGKHKLYDQAIASVSSVITQAREEGLHGTINMKEYQHGDKIILKQ